MSHKHIESHDKDHKKHKNFATKIQILEVKYKNITKEITFSKSNVKYKTPNTIYYIHKIFNIVTKNYFDKIEYTWKCKYFRRNKDKSEKGKNYCSSNIKRVKINVLNDAITFYLK